MAKTITSRRKFLIRGGLGTLGILAVGTYVARNPIRRTIIGVSETLEVPYQGDTGDPMIWFEITSDNKVLFYSPKVEMGQGTFTGLAQIAADELQVGFDQMQVIGASTETGNVDQLSTGGSLSISGLWVPLRELAATMREMIKNEAANKLGVEVSALQVENGIITGGGKSLSYAEAVADVEEWNVPATPELKSDFKIIGQPLPRVDLEEKVFGAPIFGMDAELPDMLFASVIRPEKIGAALKGADITKAENMPGVVKIVKQPDWIGVVAESQAQAYAAAAQIEAEWDVSKTWTGEEIEELLRVGKGNEMVIQKSGSKVKTEDDVVVMEFQSPIGAHAQLEPNGALAHVEADRATVILSTQVLAVTQRQVADALGMDKSQVNIIPTYLGGGFGRRLNTPHAVHAAIMSREVGLPVKYFFTRQEEFQHDMFRPPTHHVVRGKLKDDGLLESIEHEYASGDVAIGSPMLPGALHNVLNTDIGAMRGALIQYKKVPNYRAVSWHRSLPFATSWWRSLGLLANTFAIESFMDEMALKAGVNPAEFRLSQIEDDVPGKRLKNVIRVAAERSGYTDEVIEGRAMGLAASVDTGTPCAQVFEISLDGNDIRFHKVTCVMDPGLAVNPDQVKAQCEGSILMGISAAMFEQMYIEDGQLKPIIYGPYKMAQIRHTPEEIDIHLMQGVDRPFPVGEPPLGPVAAAIGNAYRRLTGKRLTTLPFANSI